jgi:hypothetical protein
MAKKTKSKKRGSKKTQAAVKALKDACKFGAELLSAFPKDEYGSYWVKKTAKENGVSTDVIRKRRALAEYFILSKDLDAICKLMRLNDSPVGVSLFDRILTVEDPSQTKALMEHVIVEKLSRNGIDRILKEKYGSRRQGGKRHQIKDISDFVNDLRKSCVTCSRLCEQGLAEDFIDKLPASLQHQIKSVFQTNQAMIAGIEEYRKRRK